MNLMRHCRQCRADAVGLLGEDRAQEFSLERIEGLEIDYQAAMAQRAQVQAQIEAQLTQQRQQGYVQFIPIAALKPKKYRPVLMAVATKGHGLINEHFGHAKEFLIYEVSQEGVKFVRHSKTELYCSGEIHCGAQEQTLDHVIKSLQGCAVLLCARIGYTPWKTLAAAGIQPNHEHAMEVIEDALMSVYQTLITEGQLQPKSA